MKKLLTVLLSVILVTLSASGFAACTKRNGKITLYVPDGAPALAIARFAAEEVDICKKFDCRVVDAQEIESCVTYADETRNADLCILPVNTASKRLGNGDRYAMLGAVTHGNLFIVANGGKEELTAENFAEALSGKKVGVVNFPAFPGAVFKLILTKYGILNEVSLENVAASQVTGTDNAFDYFVIPEPAASTRTGNPNLNLKIVGNLQSLYGESGYPQAVLVAKKSLIRSEPEFIASFMDEMTKNADWLIKEETSAQTIISAITSCYSDPDTTPAFNADNLTKTVISNCAVRFKSCAVCRDAVITVLNELKTAGDAAATAVSDSFFYTVG